MSCSKLLDYNLVDVEGLVLLDKEWNIIEDQFEQANLVVSPPEDGIFASKLHDHDTIRDFRNKMVFDTKYQKWRRKPLKGKAKIGSKFTITLKDLEEVQLKKGKVVHYGNLNDLPKIGGYVPDPLRPGVFEWVATIDFSKQYPNAIMSSNAGIKTAVNVYRIEKDFVYDHSGRRFFRSDLIETPIGYFRKDIESVNKKKFKKWLELRKTAQATAKAFLKARKSQEDPMYKLLDGKQFRIKSFTNGGFGIMGLPADRNYSQLVFNSCTLMCQDLTKKMINSLKELGYEIIGGDTDSCFVSLKGDNLDDCIAEGKELVSKINKIINGYLRGIYNITEHTMEVSLETVSDKFLVKAAKNYIKRNLYKDGTVLDEPELEVKGVSQKKRNTSRFAADMQEVIFGILLDSKEIENDLNKLINVLDKNIHKLPWEYVAPKGALNNKVEEYDESNHNARGARNAMRYLNKVFNPGDNPFIMPFKEYPKKLNGKFVSPYKGGESLVLSFGLEDIQELKELGFKPDWNDLKRTQIDAKSKPFLEMIGTDYTDITKPIIGDDMDL